MTDEERGHVEAAQISVIMPVHNGERTLNRSIDSVLRQRFPRWELLVVDDGSTDGTFGTARAMGVSGRSDSLHVVLNAAARLLLAILVSEKQGLRRSLTSIAMTSTTPTTWTQLLATKLVPMCLSSGMTEFWTREKPAPSWRSHGILHPFGMSLSCWEGARSLPLA